MKNTMIFYILKNSFNNYRHSFRVSILSYFWIFFQPMALIILYSLVFGYIMKARMDLPFEHSYTMYIAAALLPWIVFSTILQSGSLSIIQNASYIRKINLPISIFVAQDVLENSYNFLAVLLILWGFLLISGLSASWLWLAALIPLILLVIAALGISLILAILTVFVRDIEKILGFFLQLLMWGLPIVYPWNIIPEKWQWIIFYNPLFYYFDSFREILLYGHLISIKRLMAMLCFSLILLVLGLWLSRKAEYKLRDVL